VALLGVGLAACGLGVGAAMTSAYTAAGMVIPAGVHGSAFGLLSASSLAGLALSPVLSGFLGAVHIRLVFLLDLVALLVLAGLVRRRMTTAATGVRAGTSP
jgi:MFS family permease